MKTRQEKRGEFERNRRKKFRHLKNTGMLSEYYKQKRESIKIEEKAGIKLNTDKIMAEETKETKKLLFFLPADNKWSRIIRRGIVIFLLAGISGVGIDIVQSSGNYIPAIWMPLITAILAMLDKMLRELKE